MADKPIKVLLIEDSVFSARHTRMMLTEAKSSQFDAELECADKLSTGLIHIAEGGIDIILLDLTLPDSDELHTFMSVYAKAPKIPIVVMSGIEDDALAMEAVQRGAQDYLVKGQVDSNLLKRSILYAIERKRVEEELREYREHLEEMVAERTSHLTERVKELKCLYGVSNLIADPDKTIDAVLDGTVNLIPQGFQYPEITCVRITFEGMEFASSNFRETPWGLTAGIVVSGKNSGKLEVCYLEERPALDEGPFFNEERDLIEDIARQLERKIEHRRAEKIVREKERYFRSLMYNMHEDIVVIDTDYVITDINNTFLQTMGKTREEVIGKRCHEVLYRHPEPCHRYGELCAAREVFETGISGNIHRVHTKAEGSDMNVHILYSPMKDEAGNVTHVVQAIRDVTDLMKADEALRESEKQYRTLVDNLPVAVYRNTPGPEGKFLMANPAFCKMLGYGSEEDVKKVSVAEIYANPDERKLFSDNLIEKGVVENAERTLMKSDGTPLYASITARVVDGKDGEISHFDCVMLDITEQKRLEAQLQQSQKMEAIGTLAGGIAHDFNNILMAILGHCDLAETKLPEDSEAIGNLNQVKKAGTRARRLIQQILAFSRMGEQERIILSLTPLIKEALKFLKSTLPTSIEIRDYIEADPGVIEADATQIYQIVMNLCTNAEYAMREEGGTLHVKLTRVEVDRRTALQHHELHTGPHARLTVTDTGCGIGSEALVHIFDPYFTTKEKGEGTGLGLSVVHGIVTTHGGTITVESEPGKGTAFHVYFPVIEKDVETQEEDEEPLPTGNERILFVDDEQVILHVAEEMLKQLGYDVVTQKSSVEALELFRAEPDRFDLVITDMTMPKMTGDQLALELMKIRPDIPIILCTGFSHKISEEQAKEIGIKAFVMKPLVRRGMADIIREVLGD